MSEDILNFELPIDETSIIKVIGVGGGGSNAVNYMYETGIKDVGFVVCNTDAQALKRSPIPNKIQLGMTLTEGRGAGNKPEQGKQAAIESLDDILKILEDNTKMVFITAGMGGGTGTGAAPIIAKAAKERDILTVGIITIPFKFEGPLRFEQAIQGIAEMRQYVDSLLVINNEKLREIHGNQKISEAFKRADNVLAIAAKGIAEIITVHGYVNVDFEDVKTVMKQSGVALMGSASAEGENRAADAIKEALNSPLLNNNDINGAKNILLNITSGTEEITMDEVGEITDHVLRSVKTSANIIWGNGADENLGNKINVTIIATGFEANSIPELTTYEPVDTRKVELDKKEEEKIIVIPEENNEVDIIEIIDEVQEIEHYEEPINETKATISNNNEPELFSFNKEKEEDVTNFQVKPVSQARESTEVKQLSMPLEETKTMREKFEKIKALSNLSDSHVEKMENEPAYKRLQKNIAKEETKQETEVSRFTASTDSNNNIQIRENNPYLHDKVD
ncbi:MAG: cell division protein FtsZ [Bacteroidetes bacterium RIFOXYA12_FULL_35_11]|nr:MAG: cell division protein FtsZ [Bacteroidetes bacterium GWF2_35_48]OFY79250.1 MAG: cell division protein FtsZ [Bacteroidetes bacterium RIFOXYA12_FULL_35_11]OFY96241.1 MAG: cell division protein FtsZ [Bacteroidetes bacterium RIFOXYB2_FULL_35_7]OFY96442.1 MAG: cell division protein FtsZ [Bacteroidetes bacterium RIFOXYC12_FULL_35_7]HBX50507.1 cell division protein FtsZ [Bacteroidales bacterium]